MISHTKKFLFIHVPKTGGNSVSTALQTYTDIQFVAANSPKGFGVNENFWPIDPVYGSIKHFSVEHWSTLLGESISDYFLFGTVRNPFDRAISTYFFMKQAMIQNRVPWLEDHSDEARERFSKSEFHNFLVSGVPTQLSFLKSNAGLNIHLMRYERLVDDFAAVSRKLDLNQASLPLINASRRPPSTRLLDADTQKLLIDVYEEDFRSFGYGYEYELERSI
jgi:hypothetical protein